MTNQFALGSLSGIARIAVKLAPTVDREWTGNDASQRNQHGVIPLLHSPLLLALNWRAGKSQPAVTIGTFELDLPLLLRHGLIRSEDSGSVRVRFFHDNDGKIYLQTKLDAPRVQIGRA